MKKLCAERWAGMGMEEKEEKQINRACHMCSLPF